MMWLLNLIPGVSAVANALASYFNRRLDVDLEKYKVDGKIDEARLQAAMQAMSAPSYGDRAMRWVFAYPLGGWWAVALVNSAGRDYFGWTWSVHSFPLLEQWGWVILGFLFLASSRRR